MGFIWLTSGLFFVGFSVGCGLPGFCRLDGVHVAGWGSFSLWVFLSGVVCQAFLVEVGFVWSGGARFLRGFFCWV